MSYTYLGDSTKVKKISDDGKVGVFDIEGLYPGYGLTIGNSLRRVLLSSLPGSAIVQFKIKGALHEFTTVPNVLEDVVEIGLNLKQVRFEFTADEPQTLTLKVKGESKVTGADIVGNQFVKVVNPDIHLFTTTDKKAEIEMEIVVDKGLGYVPVEKMKAGKLEVGVIALDAIFTPVTNVGITVENMRVGDQTDYNRVKLTIETDGSLTPSDALKKAANILLGHFTKIATFGEEEKLASGEE